MGATKIYSNLKTQFPDSEIYQNHPLAPYTTVKIGGPADIFVHSKSSDELKDLLRFIYHLSPTAYPTILGNGSNTLISDSGIPDLVIKNSSNKIEILPNNQIKVDSGVQLTSLINFSLNHHLVGLEEFAYIPSTIGGAIFGNIHGFDKHDFNQFLESIEVFDLNTSQLINYSANQLNWSYDYSSLQDQPHLKIISAVLNLKSGDSKTAKQKYQEIIQKKITFQPMKSLGSVFKNPPESFCLPIWHEKKPAGWIVDNQLNLKGHSLGDAQVSPLHANFIVNNNQATAKDYLALIQLIQSQMQTKFNFQFELEIKLLGKFSN